jgi:hypothetical protein
MELVNEAVIYVSFASLVVGIIVYFVIGERK